MVPRFELLGEIVSEQGEVLEERSFEEEGVEVGRDEAAAADGDCSEVGVGTDEVKLDVVAECFVGFKFEGDEGGRKAKSGGGTRRRRMAVVVFFDAIDLHLELLEVLHHLLPSKTKNSIHWTGVSYGEDSARRMEGSEKSRGLDLGEDSNATKVWHEFENSKSSLDAVRRIESVQLEDLDGFKKLGS